MSSATITAETWQQFILQEVGAGLGPGSDVQNMVDDILSPNIVQIWDAWADKNWFPRLQYMYAKRHAATILAGQLRIKINKSIGPLNQQYEAYFQHAQAIIKECNDEILQAEKTARANRTPLTAPTRVRPCGPRLVGNQGVPDWGGPVPWPNMGPCFGSPDYYAGDGPERA